MKFQRISLNNWMVFKGEQELIFPQDDNVNILVLFGENMNGKTTILNSVRWCFYGEALNNAKIEIPHRELINIEARNAGEEKLEVGIDFTADGSEYSLRRSLLFKGDNINPKMTIQMKKDSREQEGGKISSEIEKILPQQM